MRCRQVVRNALLGVAVLASCSPFTPDQVGVGQTSAGEPVVLFEPCGDERIVSISLRDSSGYDPDGELVQEAGPTVWAATASSELTGPVVLGWASDGLMVDTPLQEPLRPDIEYSVVVEFSSDDGWGSDDVSLFLINDLSPERVRYRNPPAAETVPTSEFADAVHDECARGTWGSVLRSLVRVLPRLAMVLIFAAPAAGAIIFVVRRSQREPDRSSTAP